MIRCENLSKSFRRTRVLDGINLDIAPGERIALIGSNGAGKTTLIRCLLGEYVHEGKVTIDGISPREKRTSVLGQIGFVPQPPSEASAAGSGESANAEARNVRRFIAERVRRVKPGFFLPVKGPRSARHSGKSYPGNADGPDRRLHPARPGRGNRH